MTKFSLVVFLAIVATGCAQHLPPPAPSAIAIDTAALYQGNVSQFNRLATDDDRQADTLKLETTDSIFVFPNDGMTLAYCIALDEPAIAAEQYVQQFKSYGAIAALPKYVSVYATPNEVYQGTIGATPPSAAEPSGMLLPFVDVITDDGHEIAICQRDFGKLASIAQ